MNKCGAISLICILNKFNAPLPFHKYMQTHIHLQTDKKNEPKERKIHNNISKPTHRTTCTEISCYSVRNAFICKKKMKKGKTDEKWKKKNIEKQHLKGQQQNHSHYYTYWSITT